MCGHKLQIKALSLISSINKSGTHFWITWTIVKGHGLGNVSFAQSYPLPDLWHFILCREDNSFRKRGQNRIVLTWQTYLILFEILPRQDGVQVGSLAKRVPGVMHDAVVVVLQPQ